MRNYGVGSNYLAAVSSESAVATQLRALLRGQIPFVLFVYPCHSPRKKRWFVVLGLSIFHSGTARIAMLHLNVTSLLSQVAADGALGHESVVPGLTPGSTAALSKLFRESALDDVVSQLLQLAFGQPPELSPEIMKARSKMKRLTLVQAHVLQLLAQGNSNKQIARVLGRSANTIKIHVSNILKKLQVRSRTEAALVGSLAAAPAPMRRKHRQ
jgi:DNA-binding CsgD family transcriptional regulator